MEKELVELYDFVNQRYLFNDQNYPILAKLEPMEKKVFALKHALLHIQKHLYDFLHYSDPAWKDRYLDFTAKILINLLKLGEILGFSAAELAQKLQFHQPWSVEMFVHSMGAIAAECESFDHGGNFDEVIAKEGLSGMCYVFYSKTYSSNNFYSLPEIVRNVPTMMKSK